jgi:hypothetical protein
MTIFLTNEGCLGLENNYNSQKCDFFAQKRPFLALITFLRPSRTLFGPKIANKGKKYFYRHKILFRKAGSGKTRPFLRPISTFWPKTGYFKPIQPIRSKNAIS